MVVIRNKFIQVDQVQDGGRLERDKSRFRKDEVVAALHADSPNASIIQVK